MRLGVIADDFTGATDIAGLLARGGAAVRLHTGLPDAPGDGAPEAEVIALKIRTVDREEAVAQALKALDWLRANGAQRLFWKYCSTFDSTARGNIGPVAEALMQALDTAQTVYAPAFPENGRTVYRGNLFVLGVPLAESPMKDHPLTPMRDSDLCRVLAPQVTGSVGLVDWHAVQGGAPAMQAAAGATAHLIVDALTAGDLAAAARAFDHLPLTTGGSAFGAAVFGAEAPRATDRPPAPDGPSVILSGSCSAMTQAQVAAFRATGAPVFDLDPLVLATDRQAPFDWLAAHLGTAPILISSTAAPEALRAAQDALGTQAASALVEGVTADLARAARDAGAARFVVAGGETSGAVTQALGVRTLDIGPEIAPGVPWCFGTDAGGRFALALKSGNFGGPGFFAEALARLEAL